MLRSNGLLASFVLFPAGLLLCQATTSVPGAVPRPATTAAVDPVRPALELELDRAIFVLKRGLKENWATRDQYLTAFVKTPDVDRAGRPVKYAKSYVVCAIGERLRNHQVWDEGVPIEVEVQNAINELVELREGTMIGGMGSSCAVEGPQPRKVNVSGGVAASMLETKIDPVYPAEAIKNHVSGTVVLHATISTKGRVEALRVISGPESVQQAALDAVRQWTYRPYLLNNMPVEVETTINVIFAPSH